MGEHTSKKSAVSKRTAKGQSRTSAQSDRSVKKKWYQKAGWILLLLIVCFPIGFFLMWRCTKWNKVLKTIFSGIFGFWFMCICLAIAMPLPDPEAIAISADTAPIYDVNEKVSIDLEVEPADCYISKSDFQVSGGEISREDDVFMFTSDAGGEFEIYVEDAEVISNTITLKFEDKAAIEQAEQERLAAEQAEKERLAAEQAEKERLEAEQAERERLEAEQAEKEQLAAKRAEQRRIEAEQAKEERLAASRAEKEQKRIEKEQARAARQAEKARKRTEQQTKKSSTANKNQAEDQNQSTVSQEATVWLSETGEKYHNKPKCGNMNPDKAYQVSLSEAKKRGKEACKNCYR